MWPHRLESHPKEELSVSNVQTWYVMHSQPLEVFEQRVDPPPGAAEEEIPALTGGPGD